jgi:hypothetical protein
MAENYLITGYWGEPHVTSENDRGINAAIFGAGRFVLPVGEQFRAEYIGNNTVRIYDGKLIDNGAVAGIPAGEYVDLMIPEAGQGMKRNDLIIFQYSQDAYTLVEKGEFMVLSGEETSGTATDPALSQQDILTNEATLDQMVLWRVPVSGTVISAPEILYNTKFAGERIATAHSADGATYTVNLPGIAKLYPGLEFTMIPDTTSATTLPKLNVNGLGDVNIKRRITSNTLTTVQSETEEFLIEQMPIRVFYNGTCWVADMARPNAPDIYGTVSIENGGTGADNAQDARRKLVAAPDGYGLGTSTVFAEDCNKALENGWYHCNTVTENAPADLPTNCSFFVMAKSKGERGQAYQYFFHPSNGCVMQRYTTNGGESWKEEWANPPMIPGVMYRTTERHNGEPVYTLRCEVEMHGSGTESNWVLPLRPGNVISIEAVATTSGTYSETVPFPLITVNGAVGASIRVSADKVTVKTHADYTGYKAVITIKFSIGDLEPA